MATFACGARARLPAASAEARAPAGFAPIAIGLSFTLRVFWVAPLVGAVVAGVVYPWLSDARRPAAETPAAQGLKLSA